MKKIILLSLILILSSLSASAFEVSISGEENVSAENIRLGDIARIKNFSASDAALAELQDLELESSPQAGYSKNLSRVLVELSIRNLGYSRSEFKLDMPKMITVQRQSQLLSAQEIKEYIESYIDANTGSEEAVLKNMQELKDQKIAAGEYSLAAADNFELKYGRNNMPILIIAGDDVLKRIFCSFELGLKTEVLTAAETLTYGSTIDKSSFEVKEQVVFSDPSQLIREWDPSLLAGKELKRSLKKGQNLKRDDLKISNVVQWGDKLRINLNVNNINITTFVAARERGAVGEVITVENENSGYRFKAEILSESEAKMLSK